MRFKNVQTNRRQKLSSFRCGFICLVSLEKAGSRPSTRIRMPNQPPAIQTFQMPQMPRIPVRLIAGIAAIILLIVLAWTSSYTVQAESEGVVLRFGKFLKTVEP